MSVHLTKWLSLKKLRDLCHQGITDITLSDSSFNIFFNKYGHLFKRIDDDTIKIQINYGPQILIKRSWRGKSGRPLSCNGVHYKLIAGLVREGVSQSRIADLTGFSQSTISRYIKKHL